jgi:hypothetical protein
MMAKRSSDISNMPYPSSAVLKQDLEVLPLSSYFLPYLHRLELRAWMHKDIGRVNPSRFGSAIRLD